MDRKKHSATDFFHAAFHQSTESFAKRWDPTAISIDTALHVEGVSAILAANGTPLKNVLFQRSIECPGYSFLFRFNGKKKKAEFYCIIQRQGKKLAFSPYDLLNYIDRTDFNGYSFEIIDSPAKLAKTVDSIADMLCRNREALLQIVAEPEELFKTAAQDMYVILSRTPGQQQELRVARETFFFGNLYLCAAIYHKYEELLTTYEKRLLVYIDTRLEENKIQQHPKEHFSMRQGSNTLPSIFAWGTAWILAIFLGGGVAAALYNAVQYPSYWVYLALGCFAGLCLLPDLATVFLKFVLQENAPHILNKKSGLLSFGRKYKYLRYTVGALAVCALLLLFFLGKTM